MNAELAALAERIHTGTDAPDTSRALVVFNHASHAISGVAVFHADMPWPKDVPLPPVVVSDLGGGVVPSALTDLLHGPDHKGRPDRVHLTFNLRFVVRDVPPQGWRTYIAAYTDAPVTNSPEALAPPSPGLSVVETLRHEGTLPPVGKDVGFLEHLALPERFMV